MKKKRKESLAEEVARQMNTSVDTETFKFALGLFQEAATGRMTGSHIEKSVEPGLHLTNVPMNRGMLAVVRETRHLSDGERQALMLRIMHFGETVNAVLADSRFSEHVRSEGAELAISNEFIEAYSSCKFSITDKHINADIENLATLLVGRLAT
ncbi:MAG: hypothetical protein U1F56_12155 [Rubrivivax sp.]